jgi:hypothetical protein
MKSVGRSITGYKPIDDEQEICAVFHNLTAEVTTKVRKMGLAGRQVSIGVRGSTGQSWQNFVTTGRVIRHTKEMFQLIYHQLYQSWRRPWPIIKWSVRLSLLEPYQTTPLWQEWQHQEAISKVIDQVNRKYGEYTLRSALLQKERIIYPEVTGFLGDAQYHGLR